MMHSNYLLSSPLNTPKLIEVSQLASEILEDIGHATNSVHLQTMDFDSSSPMNEILKAVVAARQRGVSTSVAFDRRAYSISPYLVQKATSALKTHNVRIQLLGHASLGYPLAGRSHCKMYVIDDSVYIGGGVNLCGESFGYRDYMLKYKNAELAIIVRQIQQTTYSPTPSDDTVYALDRHNTLIVDGGKKGTSSILDTAISIADTANKAWYVSQFGPDRELAKKLNRTSLACKFNTTKSQKGWSSKAISLIDRHISRIDNDYKGSQKIHAKLLVCEDKNGQLSVVSGSHNFARSGVQLGTREIALHSTDQLLAKNLISYTVHTK